MVDSSWFMACPRAIWSCCSYH